MVTIELGNFDEETEVAITRSKARLSLEQAQGIVGLVRRVREAKSGNRLTPTVRGCIIIGRILNQRGGATNNGFKQICLDVLMTDVSAGDSAKVSQVIDEALATSFNGEVNHAQKRKKR
jgi:hypothetical protein